MRDEIASLVHPIFAHGLRLKERLQNGERLDLGAEQAALKGLLLTDLEARRLVDFGGEVDHDMPRETTFRRELGRRGPDAFLGIRYAMVCWLDEIMILDSPWSRQWNEQKLETALYGTNLRAELFWEQARRAEARPGTDALEVFYLCVVLGFRGELREEPGKLQAWAMNTQARIAKSQGQEWPAPPEHTPPTDVPPRHAREKFERMILVATILALLLIPIVVVFVSKKLFSD